VKKFPAVSIIASGECCHAAKLLQGVRLLAAEATTLPLPECTMPDQCRCRFQKHADRRSSDDDRRLPDSLTRSVWYSGVERRKSTGRRKDD
jgi:hypothetical protein